jgi:glycosyltransferase involved in cell wall biosynthesis
MKKKILFYGDSPTVATGFGTVARNIIENLHKSGKYEIDIFGINYHGTPHPYAFNIWPAMDHQAGDPYGRRKFCHFATQHDFDILFILQDTFIVDFLPELLSHLEQNRTKPFKTVMYYPIDSILKPSWYNHIKGVDQLVAYTEFGKEAFLKHDKTKDIAVVYHGVDVEEYRPLDDKEVSDFRKQYFGTHADKFIFMNVNRNQQRKDIPRTMQAFKEFQKEVPESILYLHMAKKDQGWSLVDLCEVMELSPTKDIIFPENMEPNQGYPREVLNMLYNACDCVLSTTLGEGMGLAWLEAMACKTPIIMPDNTAMTEFITEDRGYLAASGSNSSLWTCVPNDNEIMRPLVDVEDLVRVMKEIHNNYDEAKAKATNAYSWIHDEMVWSGGITKQWLKIFDDVAKSISKPKAPTGVTTIVSEEV